MSNFRTIDRQTGFLLPPSVDEWLPERHLARFVVEVIDGFDVRAMVGAYRGSGSAAHHPRMLLGVLVYGYVTGVFSSRKLERATYYSVAFRFIAANDHPDHDTIAAFRRRFLKEIEALFVQVLLVARETGVLKMGTIGLDGTKIHAKASRHRALSYGHVERPLCTARWSLAGGPAISAMNLRRMAFSKSPRSPTESTNAPGPPITQRL
jgi:transposase